MTSEQIIRVNDKVNLDRACRNFAKSLDAVSARHESTVISNKGKTLLSINRTKQATVKMTVGK